MMEICFDKIIEELNNTKFWGLNNLMPGNGLKLFLYYAMKNGYNLIRATKLLIKALFFKMYRLNYAIEGDGDTLFLSSPSYSARKDHIFILKKVSDLVNSKRVLIAEYSKYGLVRSWHDIKPDIYGLRYAVQLLPLNIDFILKIYILSQLIEIKRWCSDIERIVDIHECKALVVLCDAHTLDNVVVQQFNKLHKVTVTLQHGWFGMSHRERFDLQMGFEAAISKYFLCYGQYTKSLGERCGVISTMKVLGDPKFIGVDYKWSYNRRKLFVVWLLSASARDAHIINKNMVEFANKVSKKYGFRYLLKLHPDGVCMPLNFNSNYCQAVYKDECSMEAILSETDFSIVSAESTSYAEVIYFEQPCFCYVYIEDYYSEIQFVKFYEWRGLDLMVNEFVDDSRSMMKKTSNMKRYMFADGRIDDNYRYFLRQLSDI